MKWTVREVFDYMVLPVLTVAAVLFVLIAPFVL